MPMAVMTPPGPVVAMKVLLWICTFRCAPVQLARPQTIGLTCECVGPEVYTLAELVKLAGRMSGHRRLVIPLPDALGRVQARMMEMLPGEPLMSRDNLRSMATPNVATGRLPTLADLGVQAHALANVGPSYLARDRSAVNR